MIKFGLNCWSDKIVQTLKVRERLVNCGTDMYDMY